jgi:hypothetical protein
VNSIEFLSARSRLTNKQKRAFNIGEFLHGKAQQPLPPSLQPHEADLASFEQYCRTLCLKLLTLFGIGLEVRSYFLPLSSLVILSKQLTRSPPIPGSHLAIPAAQQEAFSAYSTIPLFLPLRISLLRSICVQEHTAIMALLRSSFNDQANQAYRSFPMPLLPSNQSGNLSLYPLRPQKTTLTHQSL